jgi:hypothetical protein
MKHLQKDLPLSDILLKIIETMPAGFVFDNIYIMQQLKDYYAISYREFLSRFAFADSPEDMASREIDGMLKAREPGVIKELAIKVHFPNIADSLTSRRLWERTAAEEEI